MKIVQSFWTKPFLQSAHELPGSRLHGGWVKKKYNYFSWALSCLQLARWYDSIELVTDEMGKYILIDKMRLPYTSVKVELNRLDNYDTSLWALGKVYAYSIQQTPFLHVDNDVFVWKRFGDHISKATLVAQNRELSVREYASTFNEICGKFTYIPSCLKELIGNQALSCANAGIIGGSDIGFFKNYTGEIFRFVQRNAERIKMHSGTLHMGNLNIIYEQVMFYRMATMQNKPVSYLFPAAEQTPKLLGNFHAAEKNGGFVHALSYYKKHKIVYNRLENTLQTLFPAYYDLIVNLLNTTEI